MSIVAVLDAPEREDREIREYVIGGILRGALAAAAAPHAVSASTKKGRNP